MTRLAKTLLTLSFALSLITGKAQVELWAETTCGEEGVTLSTSIRTSNFIDIAYFQFSLNWDTSHLQFLNLHSLNSTLGLSETNNFNVQITGNGDLITLWFDNLAIGQSLPDSSVLFGMDFMVIGEECEQATISFSNEPIPISIGNTSGPLYPVFPALSVDAKVVPIRCFGEANGTVSLYASGGSGQLMFNWEDGSTSNRIQGLSAGVYQVTITDLLTQNSLDTAFAISEPEKLVIRVTARKNVSCFGGNDGRVSALATGGTGEKVYVWSTGDTAQIVPGLPAGTYSFTVTDSNGCSTQSSITLNQPEAMLSLEAISIPDTNNQSIGFASVAPSGGTPPYQYNWSISPLHTDSIVTDLSSGDYNVTVTDANGCEIDTVLNINHITSSRETSFVEKFEAFPNPATEYLIIAIEFMEPETFRLEIINEIGESFIIQDFKTIQKSMAHYSLDQFNPGIYFVRLVGFHGQETRRFVKIE